MGQRGRPSGSPNKLTARMRSKLARAMEGQIEKIPSLIEKIKDPKEQIQAISWVMPYFMPKLQATTIDTPGDSGFVIKVVKGVETEKEE